MSVLWATERAKDTFSISDKFHLSAQYILIIIQI